MRRSLEIGWLAMLILLCLPVLILPIFSEVQLEARIAGDCGKSWRLRIDQGLQTKFLADGLDGQTTSVEQGHAVLELQANCRGQDWIRVTQTRVHFSKDIVMTFEPQGCPCAAMHTMSSLRPTRTGARTTSSADRVQ